MQHDARKWTEAEFSIRTVVASGTLPIIRMAAVQLRSGCSLTPLVAFKMILRPNSLSASHSQSPAQNHVPAQENATQFKYGCMRPSFAHQQTHWRRLWPAYSQAICFWQEHERSHARCTTFQQGFCARRIDVHKSEASPPVWNSCSQPKRPTP